MVWKSDSISARDAATPSRSAVVWFIISSSIAARDAATPSRSAVV